MDVTEESGVGVGVKNARVGENSLDLKYSCCTVRQDQEGLVWVCFGDYEVNRVELRRIGPFLSPPTRVAESEVAFGVIDDCRKPRAFCVLAGAISVSYRDIWELS